MNKYTNKNKFPYEHVLLGLDRILSPSCLNQELVNSFLKTNSESSKHCKFWLIVLTYRAFYPSKEKKNTSHYL